MNPSPEKMLWLRRHGFKTNDAVESWIVYPYGQLSCKLVNRLSIEQLDSVLLELKQNYKRDQDFINTPPLPKSVTD